MTDRINQIRDFVGELDHDELLSYLGMARIVGDNMKELEKALKERADGEIQKGGETAFVNHQPVGQLSQPSQAEGKYVVKDRDAFAQWCLKHDKYASLVEEVNTYVLKPEATDKGFLKVLVEAMGKGEMPDGVDWKDASAASPRFTLDKKIAYDVAIPAQLMAPITPMLGIEAPEEMKY